MNTITRTAAFAVLFGALLASSSLSAQGASPRAQRVDPLTASIGGTVTTADTGAPVRGAEVRLSTNGSYNRLVTTDGDGRFELPNLPAGEYRLAVSRAGFTSLQFGQRRPFEAPALIDLSEGERATANVALIRGGAIYGRVYDQFGEPVAGTRVQALRSRMVQGQRRLQSVGAGDQTDDTGAFRVYGLAPGDYYVTASAGLADSVKREPPLYYPGTPSFAEAQTVAIGPGADAAADFQLVPLRSATVSGVVLGSAGAPVEAMVNLTSEAVGLGPVTDLAGTSAFAIHGDSGPSGAFTLEDVPPGPYTLTAMLFTPGGPGRPAGPGADTSVSPEDAMRRMPEAVSMPLVVTGDDVSGLTLVTRAAGVLTGTFVADSGVVGPLPTGLRVTTRGSNAGGISIWTTGRTAREFRVASPSGPFHLDIQGLPEAWAISAILVAGIDVTDQPIDLKGQDATARVALTDRVTAVSGVVQSRRDTADSSIVVFPDDRAKWTYPSRYVRITRASDGGRFRITGLPANERYFAVALDYLEDGEEQDAEWLDRLRGSATSFLLRESEQRSIDLDLIAR